MLFGVTIFPTEDTLQPQDLARLAEERGFESLWFPEHTHIPADRRTPWPGGPEIPREYIHTLDPFVALTAAAGSSRDLKLGTSICLIAQRDPIITAKQAASVDQISDGRLLLGIGGGWNAEEAENHGTPFKQRFSILRERMLAIEALWTEEEAEFHGRHVDFDKIWSYPKPVQTPRPPVLMGGDGPTTFDRVVEFCDGWFPISRGGLPPPGLPEKIPELRRRFELAGRDPASLSVSVYFAPPEPEVVEELTRAGVDRVVFQLPAVEPTKVTKALDGFARLIY